MYKNFKLKVKKSKEEQIYFDYADNMMLLCYRYIGNIQEAEEILNNGFLKIFKNLSSFKENHKNAFPGWVKRIMINECLMHIRKRKGFNIISIEEIQTDFSDFKEVNNLNLEELLSLLTELPVGYRTVFNLYVIEGYNHKEIAKKLNVSESTSRTQLLKARRQLKKMIIDRKLRYG